MRSNGSTTGYRVLSGVVGVVFVVLGITLFGTFFAYQAPDSTPSFSTGPMGHYFIALAGCGLIAWGGTLVNGARQPELGRLLATPTAIGLVLMALYRMAAWVVGDYYLLGPFLRLEAGLFLLLALAFVWLRPGANVTGANTPGTEAA